MRVIRKSEEKLYYCDISIGRVVELDDNEIVMKIPECTDDKKIFNAVSLSGAEDTPVRTLCFVKPDILVTKVDCELYIL